MHMIERDSSDFLANLAISTRVKKSRVLLLFPFLLFLALICRPGGESKLTEIFVIQILFFSRSWKFNLLRAHIRSMVKMVDSC